MRKKKSKKLHPTGQLSIFIVLVFQALFVLFAMSLNVALVVHDKINLQNSVDIAAYYGAMKQAEMMNAIAHINYQIRQSWKLLVWRYRVLGSMGVTHNTFSDLKPNDAEHLFTVFKHRYPTAGPYFFCLGHKWWGKFEAGGNITKKDLLCIDIDQSIPPVVVPNPTGNLWTLSHALNGIKILAGNMNISTSGQCTLYGYNSWLLGAMTFMLFQIDQSNRKFMIKRLAEELAKGRELSGGYIKEGVRKTFENNLSYINLQNSKNPDSKLEQFSSLGSLAGIDPQPPTAWLDDKPFILRGYYADLYGGNPHNPSGCDKNLKEITTSLPLSIQSDPSNKANAQALLAIISDGDAPKWPDCTDSKKCKASAGIYKRDDFLVFYSVKAEIKYKNQIFLPGGRDITLKARATAMPFGGLIGPMPTIDERLPPSFVNYGSSISFDQFDKEVAPNYSRYPGDSFGLRSSLVHHYWIKRKLTNLKTSQLNNQTAYYLREPGSTDNDPLARGYTYSSGAFQIQARLWELEAISPDLFDVTYFTILPHYTYAYFPKIQKLLNNDDYIRGDLGTHKTNSTTFDYTQAIPEQIAFNTSSLSPFYTVKNLALLLTGWNPPKKKYKDSETYEPTHNSSNFGKCFHWANLSNPADPLGKIANGCIYGGRAGYSVKLVSEEFLGGIQTTTGAKMNHPLPNWID